MPKPYTKKKKEKTPLNAFADELHKFIGTYGLLTSLNKPEKEIFAYWFKKQMLGFIKQQNKEPNELFDSEINKYIDILYKFLDCYPNQITFRRQIEKLFNSIIA